MWADADSVPDLARAGVGVVLIGEWGVRRGDQRRAADAVLAAWRESSPPPGLLAYHCLLGEDAATVLHYQQWTDPDAPRRFVGGERQRWLRAVRARLTGIEHRRVTAYRRYRSTGRAPAAPPTGCLVTVTVEFDGTDPQRPRTWVDGVFAAAGTEAAAPAAGLTAAHFHLGLNGTRAVNLAEWTTAAAHRAATRTPAPRLRAAAGGSPGVAGIAVTRFAPYRGIAVAS
ncbi:antibiotic biosynthesis monooxygenase [Actinocatenispora comari]|jgi:hypothetical protein|uniref:Antibiotic biosynthesis monooxygenase n=1 Tax=Actinocatenispora comari TaxID=2807577 RepID=A0A8J4EL95_9ACTN|nr:antibiotic biosynthesis monooxygenase [Actinocatenispora comari]GIL27910.1 antibiotic biosynthesis monooxygenase [Actinocatenispora comari]